MNSLMAKALRANGLGLTQNDIDEWMEVGHNTYARWEVGIRKFPQERIRQLEDLVGTRDSWSDEMVHTAMESLPERRIDGPLGSWSGGNVNPVELRTYADDEAFWTAHPVHQGIPAGVHRSAAALAWSRLRAAGITAEIVDAVTLQ